MIHFWLALHIVGAILFVGNIVTAAYWKVRADLSGDLAVIAGASKSLMAADYAFTLPGIVLLLVSGHAMANLKGYSVFAWSWLGAAYMLFLLSGIIWAVVLLPAQRAMVRHAAASLAEGRLAPGYQAAARRWNLWGSVATVLPLLVLLLMIVKRLPF